MSREANVNVSLGIQKLDSTSTIRQISYARQAAFPVDVSGDSGPYVGAVLATLGGTFVSLAGAGVPGLAWISNQDATNSVYVGTYDNSTGRFTPFLMLKPGESYVIRLPPTLREFSGVTPGTASTGSDQLMAKALVATCRVLFEVFPE